MMQRVSNVYIFFVIDVECREIKMLSTDELFNDPNYGFILCFLEKFRTILNLPKYPAQLLEKHLIDSQQRQVPRRLIDFHFLLLKRLSRAKNARRENFEAILSRVNSILTFSY